MELSRFNEIGAVIIFVVAAFLAGFVIGVNIYSDTPLIYVNGVLIDAKLFCKDECKWIWLVRVKSAEAQYGDDVFLAPKPEDVIAVNIKDSRANSFVVNEPSCKGDTGVKVCDYPIKQETVALIITIIYNEDGLPEPQGVSR